jgi:hypothetical protein
VSKPINSGRNTTEKELREARRIRKLHSIQQKDHPSAVPADPAKLSRINTYGLLPEFYIDEPFTCRVCGKHEIWRVHAQKWYYEEAKGHIDARAVACHDCRMKKKKSNGPNERNT